MAKVSKLVIVLGSIGLVAGVAYISRPNEQKHTEKLIKELGPAWALGSGLGNLTGLVRTEFKDYGVYTVVRSVAADGKTKIDSWGAFGYVSVSGK